MQGGALPGKAASVLLVHIFGQQVAFQEYPELVVMIRYPEIRF